MAKGRRKSSPCRVYRPGENGELVLVEERTRGVRSGWVTLVRGGPLRRCRDCDRGLREGERAYKVAPTVFVCEGCKMAPQAEDDRAWYARERLYGS